MATPQKIVIEDDEISYIDTKKFKIKSDIKTGYKYIEVSFLSEIENTYIPKLRNINSLILVNLHINHLDKSLNDNLM